MGEAYRKIFWGILILTFHINLGPFQILPNFVGYFLMASASAILFDRYGFILFQKAKHIAVALGVLSLVESLFFFMGGSIFAPFSSFGPLLFGVLELLFFYHILGGHALSLEMNGDKEEREQKLRLQRRVTVLLVVQAGLYFVFSVLYLTSIMAFVLLFSILVRLYLMSIFAQLRREEDGRSLEEHSTGSESADTN